MVTTAGRPCGVQAVSQPATALGDQMGTESLQSGPVWSGVGVGAGGEGTGAVVGGCVSGGLAGARGVSTAPSQGARSQGARQLRCSVGGSWQQLLTKGCHLSFPAFIAAFYLPAVFTQILQVNLKMHAPGSHPPSCPQIHWLDKVLSALCQAYLFLSSGHTLGFLHLEGGLPMVRKVLPWHLGLWWCDLPPGARRPKQGVIGMLSAPARHLGPWSLRPVMSKLPLMWGQQSQDCSLKR